MIEKDPTTQDMPKDSGLLQDDPIGPQPRILEAANHGEGSELDLNTMTTDATCWVGTWPNIAPDQDVWLRLKGTKADGSVPYDRAIWAPPPRGPRVNPTWIAQGYYHVVAPYSYLKELKDGSELTMEFKVDFDKTTDEAKAVTFPLRVYTVRAMRPKILQAANNGEGSGLYLSTLGADATCWVGSWLNIAPDQDVWLRLKGTKADGSVPYDRAIWAPPPRGPRVNPTWIAQGYYHVVAPYSYLKELKDGSELTLEFKVDFDKTTDESKAVTFPLRTYKVSSAVLEIPTLTSVKDSNNDEVLEGSTTFSATLSLSGQANKGLKVEIFDGSGASAVSKGQVVADATTGLWACTISLRGGAHRLYAKSLYHSGSIFSNVRKFVVEEVFELPETLDLSQDDYVVVVDKAPPDVPAYARLTRAATWGRPPYRYGSSNDYVASVDAQSGEVTAMGNGQCTITATDSQGEVRSYALTVKGIRQLYYLSSSADWQGMVLVCSVADLDPVTLVDIKQLWTLYNPGNGRVAEYLGWLSYPFWTGDKLGAGTAWAYDLNGDSVNDNATAFSTDTYLPVLGISRDT